MGPSFTLTETGQAKQRAAPPEEESWVGHECGYRCAHETDRQAPILTCPILGGGAVGGDTQAQAPEPRQAMTCRPVAAVVGLLGGGGGSSDAGSGGYASVGSGLVPH